MVRMMLKLIIKLLGCGGVTLILITEKVAFMLRGGTKCDILIKHVNLETALFFRSLYFFQHSEQKANLTKLHLFPSSDDRVRDPITDTLEKLISSVWNNLYISTKEISILPINLTFF